MANLKRKYTEEEQKLLLKEYCENNKSLYYCSKLLHSNSETIKHFLIENGVHVRNRQEALALNKNKSLNRKYPVNDNYFSEPNEKMSYLLGFIAADGYVTKHGNNLVINLAIADKDFLQNIYNELGGRPIKEYQASNGHYFCSWSCASHQILEDLKKYNIINNKTFSYVFPQNLPKQYWKDFIRGYFDGDGSIYEDNYGIRLSIGSAQKNVLDIINSYFYNECNISFHNINNIKREKSIEYTLRYRAQEAIIIFNHIYYENCKLFLPRKYIKIKQLIDKKKTSTRLHIPDADKKIC